MQYLQRYFKLALQWLNKNSSTNTTNKEEILTESQDLEKILQIESPFHIPQIYGFVFYNNIAVSHQATKKICSILTKDYGKTPWLRLDESYRYLFLPNNKCITKDNLEQIMSNFAEQEAAHLIGISSMNANGYLREDALKILGKLFTAEIIPYILLRLNDWVPAVRSVSLEIFQSKLTQFHPIELIRNFILIERLERIHRNNLNKIKDEMCSHIASHQFREEVFLYLDDTAVKENIFYWKIIREEITQNHQLINQALSCKHPEIRKWVISYIPKDDSYSIYLDKLLNDRALRVRYTALKSIPKELRQEYIVLFQKGLIDRAKKIREYSRFILWQLENQNFRNFYQEMLQEYDASGNIGILLGWLEVAETDDLEEVIRLLKSPISKIKETAFQALIRLKSTKAPELYLEGIVDSNAKVRRLCTKVLKIIAEQVQTENLQLLTNESLFVQAAAIEVLSSQGASQALKSLLYALAISDKNIEKIAWNHLAKWHAKYSARPYFSKDIQLYNEIMQLYEINDKKYKGIYLWNDLLQLICLLKS